MHPARASNSQNSEPVPIAPTTATVIRLSTPMAPEPVIALELSKIGGGTRRLCLWQPVELHVLQVLANDNKTVHGALASIAAVNPAALRMPARLLR